MFQQNDPKMTHKNYWTSNFYRGGHAYLSVNGTGRTDLMLPRTMGHVFEMLQSATSSTITIKEFAYRKACIITFNFVGSKYEFVLDHEQVALCKLLDHNYPKNALNIWYEKRNGAVVAMKVCS